MSDLVLGIVFVLSLVFAVALLASLVSIVAAEWLRRREDRERLVAAEGRQRAAESHILGLEQRIGALELERQRLADQERKLALELAGLGTQRDRLVSLCAAALAGSGRASALLQAVDVMTSHADELLAGATPTRRRELARGLQHQAVKALEALREGPFREGRVRTAFVRPNSRHLSVVVRPGARGWGRTPPRPVSLASPLGRAVARLLDDSAGEPVLVGDARRLEAGRDWRRDLAIDARRWPVMLRVPVRAGDRSFGVLCVDGEVAGGEDVSLPTDARSAVRAIATILAIGLAVADLADAAAPARERAPVGGNASRDPWRTVSRRRAASTAGLRSAVGARRSRRPHVGAHRWPSGRGATVAVLRDAGLGKLDEAVARAASPGGWGDDRSVLDALSGRIAEAFAERSNGSTSGNGRTSGSGQGNGGAQAIGRAESRAGEGIGRANGGAHQRGAHQRNGVPDGGPRLRWFPGR